MAILLDVQPQTQPLIGRRVELAAIREALDSGPGRCVVLTGEPGLGKSRLILEMTLERSREMFIVGQCLQVAGEVIPLAALDQLLHQSGSSVDDDNHPPLHVSELARFNRWLDVFEGPDPGPDQVRPPRTIVIEDLHWADPATLRFIAYAVACLPWRRLNLIVTFRPHPDLSTLWTETGQHPGVTLILLPPLPSGDAEELIRTVTGRPAPEGMARVVRLAEGNPFFLRELAGHEGVLPHRLNEWLHARVDALSRPVRRLITAMAVAGGPVDDEVLTAVCALDPDAFANATREALQVGCIDLQLDGYAIRHALLQEAVVLQLSPSARRGMHEALGDALAGAGELTFVGASRCAAHYDAAAASSKSLSMHAVAADLALASKNYADAWNHYKIVLESKPDPASPLFPKAAEAAHWAGDMEASVHLLESVSNAASEPGTKASLLERLGRYRWDAGQSALSRQAYESAYDLARGPSADEAVLARVHAGLARAALIGVQYEQAVAHATQALAYANGDRTPDVTADAKVTLGVSRCRLGQDEGLVDLREGLGLADRIGDAEEISRGHANLIYVLSLQGRHDDAAEAATVGLAATTRYGLGTGAGTSLAINAASVMVAAGRLTESQALLARLLETQEPRGRASLLYVVYAELLSLLDRRDEAQRALLAAEQANDVDDPWVVADRAVIQGEVHLGNGDHVEARAAVRAGIDALRQVAEPALVAHLCWVGTRIEKADAAQLPQRVRVSCIAGARRLVTQIPQSDGSAEFAAADASARTELADLEGRSRPGDFAGLVELWRATGRQKYLCLALLRETEAWLGNRQRGKATGALIQAHAIAARMGATALVRRAEELAALGRLSLAPAETGSTSIFPGLGLTPREEQVLDSLADGLTNRQIGRALSVTERTASVHVSNILRKLQLDNRVQAANLARSRRITEPTTPNRSLA